MNSPDKKLLWALHNPIKSWTLYNLSEAEVGMLVLTLSVNDLRSLKICKKNENTWQAFNKLNHPEFFLKELTDHYLKKEAYADIETTENSTAVDTEFFVIKPNKTLHPRLHTRYEIPASCVLVGNNNKKFATTTIDLSEGGFYFRDIIPDWVAGYFLVIVDEKYQLMCSLVEDQKERKRVQIVSEESDLNFMQYKNWLSTL